MTCAENFKAFLNCRSAITVSRLEYAQDLAAGTSVKMSLRKLNYPIFSALLAGGTRPFTSVYPQAQAQTYSTLKTIK